MSKTDSEHDRSRTDSTLNRRNILLAGTTLAAASAIAVGNPVQIAQAQQKPAATSGGKPILTKEPKLLLNNDNAGGARPAG